MTESSSGLVPGGCNSTSLKHSWKIKNKAQREWVFFFNKSGQHFLTYHNIRKNYGVRQILISCDRPRQPGQADCRWFGVGHRNRFGFCNWAWRQACSAACLSARSKRSRLFWYLFWWRPQSRSTKRATRRISGRLSSFTSSVRFPQPWPPSSLVWFSRRTLFWRAGRCVFAAPRSRHCGCIEIAALMNLVANPINAVANANYIGILAWALVLGAALRNHGSDVTRQVVAWYWRRRFPPSWNGLSVLPLWAFFEAGCPSTIAETGFERAGGLCEVAVAVLLGCVWRLSRWWSILPSCGGKIRRSLLSAGVYLPARESGVYASLPVFLPPISPWIWLWRKTGAARRHLFDFHPVGATVNMGGAAITITVLAMAAACTCGIQVDFATALLLSLVATVSACGASGVAGGSLLLILLACNLFGISNDVAMQVVAVGFIISVIQDSAETALDSSTDVLFTAAADLGRQRNRAE